MKPHNLICVALAFPLTVQADVFAEASFNLPTISVVDLDPNDGVTPTFQWRLQSSSVYLENHDDDVVTDQANASDWTTVLNNSLYTVYGTSQADLNLIPGMGHASSTGKKSTVDGAQSSAFTASRLSAQFTMTGYGQVLISMPYTLNASVNGYTTCGVWYCDTAFSSASLSAYFINTAGEEFSMAESDGTDQYLWSGHEYKSGNLTLSLVNTSATDVIQGDFWVDSYAQSITIGATPVPDPEIWTMLLAGLGLVGRAARRRG